MSTIGPPSRPTGPLSSPSPHPGRLVALNDEGSDRRPGVAEDRATREAQARMVEAQRRVAESEVDAETEIEHIRDRFDRQSIEETSRQDELLNKEKMKGYEALRDVRRNQQQEIAQTRRQGDEDLARTRTYYQHETTQASHHGAQELRDLQARNATELEYARRQGAFEADETRSTQETQLRQLKDDGDSKLASLSEGARAEYDRMRANSVQARDEAQGKFDEKFQQTIEHHDEIIGRMNNRASENIRQIRQDTSQKLSAYHTRQQDPFYKMVDLNMKVQDTGEHYVLTADIPEYEQKHISVAVRGSQLVVSGFRRNEEKLDIDAGHSKGTAAYQSFHEAFPLSHPVDAKQLSREFNGNQLVVTVPKKQEYVIYQPGAKPSAQPGRTADGKPAVERAKVEKPHFPENITPVNGDKGTGMDGGPRSPDAKTRGSGTLS